MQAGRLLLGAGRLHDALAFLEQARPGGEEERIERLFLLGRIEMRLGKPRQAAERFEAILALRPGLTRVRLELARAYYAAGRDEKARYHFGSALADELPSSVEAAVEGFLRRIDARRRWSISFSAAVLPETNPARRTEREIVSIGGVPFRLNPDARASSGVGGFVSAGFSFSPTVAEDLRAVLAISTAAKVYRQSEWNDVTVSGEAGAARLFDGGSAAGGLRFGHRRVSGDSHYRSIGPWMRTTLRLSKSVRLDLPLSAEYRRHDAYDNHDGWRVTSVPRLLYALDGQTAVETEPILEAVGAKTAHHRYRLVGIGLRFSRAFEGGLSVSAGPSIEFRRHAARDPLFGKRRSDRKIRLSGRVLHRSLQYRGFAPYVGYSFETGRSNIPIHEYRIHGLSVGVTGKF